MFLDKYFRYHEIAENFYSPFPHYCQFMIYYSHCMDGQLIITFQDIWMHLTLESYDIAQVFFLLYNLRDPSDLSTSCEPVTETGRRNTCRGSPPTDYLQRSDVGCFAYAALAEWRQTPGAYLAALSRTGWSSASAPGNAQPWFIALDNSLVPALDAGRLPRPVETYWLRPVTDRREEQQQQQQQQQQQRRRRRRRRRRRPQQQQQQQQQNIDMDYTQRIPSTGLLRPAPGCQA